MADIEFEVLSGAKKVLADMGDGTFAEVIALPQTQGAPWDGSPIDLTRYGTVIVWCDTAPPTARALLASDDGVAPQAQVVTRRDGADIVMTSVVDTIGRYALPGNCWWELGGTGGAYRIRGIA